MRQDDIEVVRVAPHADGVRPTDAGPSDASLGELFKRLSSDTGDLIRQEAHLAKAEMREVGARLGKDAAKVGVAAGLALAGGLTLTAFLVLLLGNLLGGAFWLAALIVGVVFVAIGAVLLKSATSDIKEHGVKPEQTLATLRNDKEWASREARELKRDLTTDPTTSSATTPPTMRT